jgi:pentatricopeptide repeat protein
MISCYVQRGQYREALDLYKQMQSQGPAPDEATLVPVFSACGRIGDLIVGNMVHLYIRENIHNPDISLINSLLDMYAKCG